MTMRHRITAFLTALAALLAVAAPAWALDIEASGYFGNLGLPWEGTSPRTDAAYPANLWLYGGSASFSEELGPGFSLVAGYQTDPVLRHVVRGVISYESGIASIGAGPMVGVFNSASSPLKAGIHIDFRLEAPGIAFISTTVESSMGAGLIAAGDYSQELSEIRGGWYVFNAICSVSMLTKRLTSIPATGSFVVDMSTDYLFGVDVYKKGAAYRVLAELGYRAMTKTYTDGKKDGLGAVVLGVQVNADVTRDIAVRAGLDSGVYVYGTDEMAGHGPAPTAFMFNASLGVIMRFPKQEG